MLLPADGDVAGALLDELEVWAIATPMLRAAARAMRVLVMRGYSIEG